MIYKIFPSKDTTIYSQYSEMNTGMDEILDISLEVNGTPNPSPQSSRVLIQFNQSDINNVISLISSSTWTSDLKLSIANVEGLIDNIILDIYPIAEEWNMGLGKYQDDPINTSGASWEFSNYSGSNSWNVGTTDPYITSSYDSVSGGAIWYTGSSNTSVLPITSSQLISYYSDKDLNVNISNIIKAWVSGTIDNNGLIIKQRNEFINNINYQPKFKYFSRDTNTIYPPYIEFKWDDSTFNTGSSNQTILDNPQSVISISENSGFFYSNSINKFRINSRPEYPPRVYQTGSIYTTNYYLPSSSYYAIQDMYTNEFVIDFDEQFTKISADSVSNYFVLNMNGLEPERYYKIVIKTIIGDSTIIFDNNTYFKIING